MVGGSSSWDDIMGLQSCNGQQHQILSSSNLATLSPLSSTPYSRQKEEGIFTVERIQTRKLIS